MVFHRDQSLERDFGRILRLVFLQTKVLEGMPCEEEDPLRDSEVLAYKILQHATSVLVLYRGTPLDDFGLKTTWRDLFSILGLARMCHESYVLFHHIFVEPDSEEERQYRHLAWLYVDARKQARFPIHFEEFKAVREERREFADELIHKLEENAAYEALSLDKKRQICKHLHWPFVSWATLARQAGFNDHHASEIYKYLCSYSHPGSLAIRQAREAAKQSFTGELSGTGLKHVAVLLACLASDIPAVCPASRPVLEVDAEGRRLVALYAGLARDKLEDYGLKLVE